MSFFSGQLRLRAAAREHGRTVLAEQAFRAPFHLSKPYWDADARVLVTQVVNPTAGILSGDRLESAIAVEGGAALLVTSPSASRVFKMTEGHAEGRQSFRVDAGGWLEVLPEPLVPHRGSIYRQSTMIEVAPGGALFFVDQLMPGRIGHGEAWAWTKLSLEVTAHLGSELILRERFEHSGADLKALAQFAGSGDSACFANAVLIAPDNSAASATPSSPPPWRSELAALHGNGLWLGVSALRRDGWSLKIVAPDPIRLRETLRAVRRILSVYLPALRCEVRKL